MKNLMKNYSCILFLGLLGFSVNGQAQNTWNPAAPVNPVPLKYTSFHHGLKGPVKSVDNMLFDKQGLITEETGDDGQIYTYSKNGIEVSTNEYTFQYKYNEANQVVSLTLDEMDGITSYSYDEKGNLISVLEIQGPNKMKTVYTYDDQNRVILQETIYGEDTSTRSYEYYGEVEALEITEMMDDDRSSKTTYYYKNGVLDNYEQMGEMQREEIVYDSYGNWTQFFNPVYGETQTRTISYY
ncbi:MAG TPA: hypothetical protein VFD77_07430 [Brumimicrobium sp.]|nr:hypothetical protein [Brumimicrobium sp.]